MEDAFTTHVIIENMKKREKLLAGVEERLLALILRANRARIYEDLLGGADVRMDKALYPVLVTAGYLLLAGTGIGDRRRPRPQSDDDEPPPGLAAADGAGQPLLQR